MSVQDLGLAFLTEGDEEAGRGSRGQSETAGVFFLSLFISYYLPANRRERTTQ